LQLDAKLGLSGGHPSAFVAEHTATGVLHLPSCPGVTGGGGSMPTSARHVRPCPQSASVQQYRLLLPQGM
jgi:hypothetical protein